MTLDLAAAYSRLQQELISVRSRLDRQVEQLTRLNRLSDVLLSMGPQQPSITILAEALADVLDVGIGAVWILPQEKMAESIRFACSGCIPDQDRWRELGPQIEAQLRHLSPRKARRLAGSQSRMTTSSMVLPGLEQGEAMACRCLSRDGHCHAVVLAANPAMISANCEPISDDALEVLNLIAEKVGAHLDQESDRLVIEAQVEALHASETRLELVLQGTNDGWWDWDVTNDTCFLSARWQEMLGYPRQEAAGTSEFWIHRLHPGDRNDFEKRLKRALEGEIDSIEAELRLRHEDGSYLSVLARGKITRDCEGKPGHFAGSILDLSERKRHEAHVHRLDFYDTLTQLPNRRLLVDRLQQLASAYPRLNRCHGVLKLDLDRFKTLNDTYGHAAGDQLLCAVSRQLRALVPHDNTVARLGGDEFVVVLERLASTTEEARLEAQKVAAMILKSLNRGHHIDIGVVHSSVSIGIALMTEPELSVETLLQQAGVALFEAKKLGQNQVQMFEPAMQQRIVNRSRLESKLRQGFVDDELRVNYQAQVDALGRLCGMEALMRWDHQGTSLISPSEFIPIAEESGVIHALRRWSLETVCHQISRWGLVPSNNIRVAVNISPTEFLHPDFPDDLIALLRQTGIPGSLLNLEITEATVLTDLEFAAKRMHQLRSHNLEFSLDDFGTGFSSITYLRHLPVREVKIDRSYVERFSFDPQDAAIVRTIVALCDTLGLRMIAEGVETEQQWDLLRQLGCRHFQGYLFGRPQPATADLQMMVEPRFRKNAPSAT
ncbi:EAL domain-containing protein [Synechococcus sp. CBW1002]|uniref:putative bifunctional diguanylate cyclase/phosphodiesterase n=1 Tax=Synechococcus sp. CBW1002 TaxID=1353134 RepID=UPI0018CEABF6|nr:GGDEF domain-containing phosphodiesterase [Synechococcus sp. CBW1002]QPN60169.1 EAL domain-containing protein [Synechococcus sp. CBW1002]